MGKQTTQAKSMDLSWIYQEQGAKFETGANPSFPGSLIFPLPMRDPGNKVMLKLFLKRTLTKTL